MQSARNLGRLVRGHTVPTAGLSDQIMRLRIRMGRITVAQSVFASSSSRAPSPALLSKRVPHNDDAALSASATQMKAK